MVHAPSELANILANYFQNKVTKLIENIDITQVNPLDILNSSLSKWINRRLVPEMVLREISEIETLELIKNLGNSTSHGHDNIEPIAIKLAATQLYRPLHHLLNLSIRNRKFAMKWKVAKIIPIFKGKGANRLDPSAYRPISQLSVTSKLSE